MTQIKVIRKNVTELLRSYLFQRIKVQEGTGDWLKQINKAADAHNLKQRSVIKMQMNETYFRAAGKAGVKKKSQEITANKSV